MSELKLISPMLDHFAVGNAISEHSGVRCYPAMKNGSDTRYILKVISIPASQVQVDALLLSGAYQTREQVSAYFAQLAKEVENELDILNRLAKLEGFLTYEACQVVANEESSGYDIYLLGCYKRSLERHFRKFPMTHLAAVNLGLDMCASLAVCRQAGYLYADLKPGNIFISEDNEYRIGDLGILPIVGLKYASLPDRCRSSYTAPELSDPFAPISPNIDIYALGLILYQAYNGGTLPFSGTAPSEPLPSPLYADYEMSEIILKACAPDPADRWEDPIKMGQALVSYMQRNGVDDTPIVPPAALIDEETPAEPVPFEEEPDSEPEVLFEQADEAGQMMIEQMLDLAGGAEEEAPLPMAEEPQPEELPEDDPANLSFLDDLTDDETAPQEEMADQIVYDELTTDVSDMLEQADDLIAHETPAPAVAPEPIDVPMPEPILPEPEVPADPVDQEQADPVDETVAAISQALASDSVSIHAENEEPLAEEAEPEAADEAQEEETFDSYEEEKPRKNTVNRLLAGLLVLIILGCLAVAGYLFYRDYYIKTIDEIHLKGVDNQLTVSVSTNADHELLTVICTDTYGNKIVAPVENGFATFTDLTPNSLYTITVDIQGFHGVKGDIRATYTTAPQTEIMSFQSVAGADAGTAILNFTIKGHDFDQWKLTYKAEGESERTTTFSGHMVTVTGLTVGKTYSFTLDAAGNGYVVGRDRLEYTASELIYPADLDVPVFDETGLTVTWNDPEGVDVTQWTVLCYNDTGYNQNITTADNTALFTGIDPSASYTVEVTAAGMSVGGRFYISKNAVTISDFQAVPNKGGLDISWTFAGNAPAAQWVLTYSLDGGATENAATTNGTTGRIDAIVPGAVYTLKLQLQDGTTVINSVHTLQLPQAQPFSDYGATAEGMVWRMCLAPAGNDWIWWNVQSYQDTFTAGQRAGFVARLTNRYGMSNDPVNVVYAIRDAQGAVVSVNAVSQSWTSMWYQFYGEFNVPSLPQTPGQYTMEIYFNGASVHQQGFTIAE